VTQDLADPVATATAPASTSTEVVLQTQRLTKRFGGRTAVNGLDMEVHRGDVFGLLGPNGAGKSTTLRMVLGLIWPTAGSISLFGQPVTLGGRRALLQRVGAIIEQPSFYPYLSGRQNLAVVARFAGQPNTRALRQRIEDVLQLVSLADRAKDAYKRYSLGMKQRLGLAAALLTEPELVILDEPTNGLDPAGIVEMRDLIGQLAQSGMTVVLSSHLLHEVQQVCNRVAILNFGSVIAQGRVADLLASRSGLVVAFEQPDALSKAQAVLLDARRDGTAGWIKSLQYVQPEPGAWTPPGGQVLLVDAPSERAADITALLASQGLYLSELRRSAVSLEQFFLDLTGAPGTNGVNGAAGANGARGQQGGQA
jgi:ABC-2 type transport system ATP-binding protein